MDTFSESDALLSLGAVIDIGSLREVIKDAVASVLPKVERVYVYLLDGEARLTCNDPPHELPQEGKLRDAVLQQQRVECSGLPLAELQGKPMVSLAAPLAPDRQVLIIPLVDKDSGTVVCVILVHCSRLSDPDQLNLRALEKHILVSYRRIQALQKLQPWPQVSLSTSSSQNSLAKTEGPAPKSNYSDLDRKILQLCGELYDLDAASLQLKVINYLKQETRSPCCCLLLVSEDNHQLFCQVVGDKVLEEEISFPLTVGHLGKVVEEKTSITLQDISLADLPGTLQQECRFAREASKNGRKENDMSDLSEPENETLCILDIVHIATLQRNQCYNCGELGKEHCRLKAVARN